MAVSARIPVQPTRLIGRDADLAALRARLARLDVRLLTLTGVGGIGKTRLAVALADLTAPDFADGVFFVDLASVRDASLVEAAILRSLGTDADEGRGDLRVRLRLANVLVVLDNFEHVALAAPLVSELLSATVGTKFIVTSRRSLRLRWENEWRVPPLDGLAAQELFVERATARDAAFVVDRSLVAAICERLDQLPLAIELAAAQVKSVPVARILKGLDRPLTMLTNGAIDAPERQRAMRDAIAWSYDLLSRERRELFAGMAVFLGGFSLDAFVAVAGLAQDRAAGVLSGFVDESLLTGTVAGRDASRYRLLEVVREFALERLTESGHLDDKQRAHALYFLRLVEDLRPQLFGPDEIAAYAVLHAEHGNAHAALRWFLDAGETEDAARLAIALSRYWHTHGTAVEAERWFDAVLARSEALDSRLRSRLLSAAGNVASVRAKSERAMSLHEEALELARAVGDRERIASCLLSLAYLVFAAGDDARATTFIEEHGTLIGRDDDSSKRGTLAMLGWIAVYAGDLARARELFSQHNEVARRMGSRRYLAHGLQWLAELAELEGDRGRASALTRHALVIFRELGGRFCLAEALGDAARLLAIRDDAAAAILFGAAESARENVGVVLKDRGKQRLDASIARAKVRLGEREFADAWQRGREMDLERAVALILASLAVPAAVSELLADMKAPPRLTRRELEIAELVATGLTNPQIARKLVIGERTVDTHVENLLHKLDFATRAQVVAWVTERRFRGATG